MSETPGTFERRLLDRIQGNFPLSPDPYGDLGRDLGCGAEEVRRAVAALRKSGIIRRLGGSFAADKLGYVSTLVAVRVEPARLKDVAESAAVHPEVTHDYEREGTYNLWFTVTAPTRERMAEILDGVRRRGGVLEMHELPALRVFKIKVEFDFEGSPLPAEEEPREAPHAPLDDKDRRIIARACGDIGDSPCPFAAMAFELGLDENDLLARLKSYKERGVLRRFGAMLRHREAGFTANGMSVWNVPEGTVESAGKRLAASRDVSHCYERPRFPGWSYNVFGMIHGRSREECLEAARRISRETGIDDYQVLFSVREFKKTSMVYGR